MLRRKERYPHRFIPDQDLLQLRVFRETLLLVLDRPGRRYTADHFLIAVIAGSVQGLGTASEKRIDKIIRIVEIRAPFTVVSHEPACLAQVHAAVFIIADNRNIQADRAQIICDHFQHTQGPDLTLGIGSQFQPDGAGAGHLADDPGGFFRIILKPSLVLFRIPDQSPGEYAVHQSSISVIELVQYLLPVDAHLDGFPDPDVIKRRRFYIQHQVLDFNTVESDPPVLPLRSL